MIGYSCNHGFIKSFKGDRFCFLVESGSGEGSMAWTPCSQSMEMIVQFWIYQLIPNESSLPVYGQPGSKVLLLYQCVSSTLRLSLGGIPNKCTSGALWLFINNLPRMTFVWDLNLKPFVVMLFLILNQLQFTVPWHSMKFWSMLIKNTTCLIWPHPTLKMKNLYKMMSSFGQRMNHHWWFTRQEQPDGQKELYILLAHWQQWLKCFMLDGTIVRTRNPRTWTNLDRSFRTYSRSW